VTREVKLAQQSNKKRTFRIVSFWCIDHCSVVNGCSELLATVIFMGVLSAFWKKMTEV
jgi:hypothetical protein